jgi:hypothetical protein
MNSSAPSQRWNSSSDWRTLGVEGVVVVDDVEDDDKAAAVAFADAMLELVAPAPCILDRHVVGRALAPARPVLELRHWHQLDGIDAEVDEVVEQAHRALEGAAIDAQVHVSQLTYPLALARHNKNESERNAPLKPVQHR